MTLRICKASASFKAWRGAAGLMPASDSSCVGASPVRISLAVTLIISMNIPLRTKKTVVSQHRQTLYFRYIRHTQRFPFVAEPQLVLKPPLAFSLPTPCHSLRNVASPHTLSRVSRATAGRKRARQAVCMAVYRSWWLNPLTCRDTRSSCLQRCIGRYVKDNGRPFPFIYWLPAGLMETLIKTGAAKQPKRGSDEQCT